MHHNCLVTHIKTCLIYIPAYMFYPYFMFTNFLLFMFISNIKRTDFIQIKYLKITHHVRKYKNTYKNILHLKVTNLLIKGLCGW